VNRNLYDRVRGYAIAHVNSLYPDFDPVSGQPLRSIVSRPEGYSDHDAPIGYFALAAPTEVSSQFRITSSGLVFNRATGVYSGSITIRYDRAGSITGPFNVVLSGVPQGITFVNETGISAGGPYFTLAVPSLSTGGQATVQIQFRNSTAVPPSWTPLVYSGEF
jgi:hypothetical protein